MFLEIYKNLCDNGKTKLPQYGKGSGLHKHHINPVHSGGIDEEENFTYLTVRDISYYGKYIKIQMISEV